MSEEKSPARRGLELLLYLCPTFEVLSVEYQRDGPWVFVELGKQGEGHADPPAWARYPWAIWKTTGAVHGMFDGAVTDDPVFTLDGPHDVVIDLPSRFR